MAKKSKDTGESRRERGRTPIDGPVDLPRWLPPALYAVLAAFLFREFIFSDRMLVGSDTLAMGYVVRELYAEALHTLGRIPRWAPHILGGTPFLEALSAGDSLYPPSLLLLAVLEPYRALGWKLVLHVFLAGLFFFAWVRAIGGSRPAALLGGAAYMLAPFLIGFVHPGHDGKIFVTALAPLLFWATERHFARPGLGSVGAIGLVVAMVLYTTHFQMAYFLFGGVGLYAIFRAIQVARGGADIAEPDEAGANGSTRHGRPRAGAIRFALFLAASVLGAAGAAYQFVPAVDYVTEYSRRVQTTRDSAGETGRVWSSSWSMHPEEAMSLVVPEFAGNQANGSGWTSGTYWGRNALKDNHEYAGLVVLLLAAVSFLGAARRSLRLFFLGLGLFALAFGLGTHTPVWGLLHAFLPGIRLFRAPGMAVFLFGFGAITLASLGLDRVLQLIRERDDAELARVQRVLWIGTGIVGGLAVLMTSGVFTTLWTGTVYPTIDQRRLQILAAHLPNIARGAALATLLAAATAGAVWAGAKAKLSARAVTAALVALVVVDAARVDVSFIQTMDFFPWSQPDPNIRALLEREQGDEPYRLLSFARAGQDVSPAMYGVELAAGHHPNDLSRYRELIGMVGSGLPENLLNANVRGLLNVRYILWPDVELGSSPQGPVVSRTQYGEGRPYHTLLADRGLPRARLVASAVRKSDDEAVAYIMSPAHTPETEAVLAVDPPVALEGGPVTGGVTWVERGPDRHELRVESDRPALLVVADNWYPAWKARVNGQESEVLRAYHTLRAVPVPAGSSTVEMWYSSELLERSFLLSLIVLFGLAGACGLGWWQRREATS
jgi:hypothetical protein